MGETGNTAKREPWDLLSRLLWIALSVSALLASAGCIVRAPPREIPAPCETNEACEPTGTCIGETMGEGRCLRYCFSSTRRCLDGAWCRAVAGGVNVCWDGGDVEEGEVSVSEGSCAFGLSVLPDYTVEPLVYRCARVCETDAHCEVGEACMSGGCQVPCGTEHPCDPIDHCVEGVCVNERRYARLDCDGDGYPDCRVPYQCDPDAIGGCSTAPRGEE